MKRAASYNYSYNYKQLINLDSLQHNSTNTTLICSESHVFWNLSLFLKVFSLFFLFWTSIMDLGVEFGGHHWGVGIVTQKIGQKPWKTPGSCIFPIRWCTLEWPSAACRTMKMWRRQTTPRNRWPSKSSVSFCVDVKRCCVEALPPWISLCVYFWQIIKLCML